MNIKNRIIQQSEAPTEGQVHAGDHVPANEVSPVTISHAISGLNLDRAGEEMHGLMERLYPICRSITGDGLRQSLRILQEVIPLGLHQVATGTQVFDWTVPKEWNIRDAYVKNAKGERIIDYQKSNLHVLNYSLPYKGRMSARELKEHLFSLPEKPEVIPYRTSYYQPTWGFCVSHEQLLAIEDGQYDVCIDSTLENGHLTYGELLIPGSTTEEILVSSHCCHPSLCNDNLSGVVLSTYLAKLLMRLQLRYSYRFLFIPVTIGSIAWLALNEDRVHNIKHGLVAACVGDVGPLTYKKSRKGTAEIDRTVMHVLKHSGVEHSVRDFTPVGYDERQYSSPGFDLPVGLLTRTPHGEFPEYHTSADDLDFVRAESLADSLKHYLKVFEILEDNRRYVNLQPKGEPQLGKRGLYSAFGGYKDQKARELSMSWVLNFSDGHHSILDIAERSGLEFGLLRDTARILLRHKLLRVVDE